jgi:hypothetical protein
MLDGFIPFLAFAACFGLGTAVVLPPERSAKMLASWFTVILGAVVALAVLSLFNGQALLDALARGAAFGVALVVGAALGQAVRRSATSA